jgi:ketosteroid isomerase-like protein
MSDNLSVKDIPENTARAVERVYHEWDRAWSNDDLDAMVALYAPGATQESPLIPHLLGEHQGVLRGRDQIRKLLDKAAPRKPGRRSFYRRGYFTNGSTLVWEYPRATPTGEQMDFVEVMEVADGMIQAHRVYWGWRGVEIIRMDAYYKDS